MALDIGYYFSCLGVAWFVGILVIHSTGVLVARRRYLSLHPTPADTLPPEDLPGVSILRPLSGLECNLKTNLASSILQSYPFSKLEILFSVASPCDPAIPLVRDLIASHPLVPARLVIGDDRVGVNPKINNLVRAYREAKHDVLWVLDSNVLTSTDTLHRSVTLLAQPRIGLVHHVPVAILPSRTWGARVEASFLNGVHAKMYLAINASGIDSCLVGKSNLFRRSDLERATSKLLARTRQPGASTTKDALGDFHALETYGRYLGEDNMIGSTIWHELGVRHGMTSDVAGNAVGDMSLKAYFWRRVRWIRVRKYMVTASTLAEPFTEPLLLTILTSLAFRRLFGIPSVLFAPLAMGWFIFADAKVSIALAAASPSPLSSPDQPLSAGWMLAWALREVLALPIWLYAMCGDRVSWREGGKEYRVKMGGEVEAMREGEGKVR